MIDIVYDRGRHKLTMNGHAGAGEPGSDLVCAAASMLAMTVEANAAAMQDTGVVERVDIVRSSGSLCVVVFPKEEHKSAVRLVMDAVCGGFFLLAQNEPEHVRYNRTG